MTHFLALILTAAVLPLHSTLVVCVPTNTGIVVAAETRQTIVGSVYCDGKPKILISPHSRVGVGAITGNPSWYDFPGISKDKLCEFMAQTTPSFDLAPVVEGFLEEHRASITRGDIEQLRDRCAGTLQGFFSSHPMVATQTNPGELAQILIATFDSKARASSIWSFKVFVDNSPLHGLAGGEVVVRTWRSADKGDADFRGEAEYFHRYVRPEAAREIHCKPTVSATDEGYGRWIAIAQPLELLRVSRPLQVLEGRSTLRS